MFRFPGISWQRLIWIMVLVAGGLLLAAQARYGSDQETNVMSVLPLKSTPLPLDKARPDRVHLGQLCYLGGLILHSPDPRFGGISGMRFTPQGHVLAISDRGWWVGFHLQETAQGRPVGADQLRIAPLRGAAGGHVLTGLDGDAEALELTPHGLIVSFEQKHRLVFYHQYPFAPEPVAAPPEPRGPVYHIQRKWAANGGGEAMARLPDGRILILQEDATHRIGQRDVHAGVLIDQQGREVTFSYLAPKDFRPTDAAVSADGRVFILHRRYVLGDQSALIAVADVARFQPGAHVEARELARLRAPVNVDNMEALAVRAAPDGMRLTIMSDDNHSPLQRTLLMTFLLPNAAAPACNPQRS